FEDLLAAHRTEREPGQLPPEGVVLIGVDLELQRRMAQRLGAPLSGAPSLDAPLHNAPIDDAPEACALPPAPTDPLDLRGSPNNIGAPYFAVAESPAPNNGEERHPAGPPHSEAPDLGAPHFSAPDFDWRKLVSRRPIPRAYTVRPVSRIEDICT